MMGICLTLYLVDLYLTLTLYGGSALHCIVGSYLTLYGGSSVSYTVYDGSMPYTLYGGSVPYTV